MQDDDEGHRPGRSDPLSRVLDAVYHLDRERVLTYVNAAGEAMLGRAADLMLGRRFFETLPGLRGTVVETYLGARGLVLPSDVLAADVTRFHPACPFGRLRHPAMVCLMRDVR